MIPSWTLAHSLYGTLAEEMETASAAQIAAAFGIPYLAIRVLSNNITNNRQYNEKTGEDCQDFVFKVIQAHVARDWKL